MTMRKPDAFDGNLTTHRALRREGRVHRAISRSDLWMEYACVDGVGHDVGDRLAPAMFERWPLAGFVLDELYEAASAVEPALGARPVRAVVLEGGREVFLHDVPSRVGQRLWLDVAMPVIDPAVPGNVYSYGPGRDRLAALHHARALMRRGYVFAHKFDIRAYFDHIDEALVLAALATRTMLSPTMRNIVRFFLGSAITRAADHPGVLAGTAPTFERERRTLLQGSAIAPALSNIAGAHAFVDSYGSEFGAHAPLLVFADDGLLAARDPRTADLALTYIRELIGRAGMELKETKTTQTPVSLSSECVRFLGKDLGINEIETPRAWVQEQLMEAGGWSGEARASKVASVLMELQLDPIGNVHRAEALAESVGLGPLFRRMALHLRPARNRLLRRHDASMPMLVREALAS